MEKALGPVRLGAIVFGMVFKVVPGVTVVVGAVLGVEVVEALGSAAVEALGRAAVEALGRAAVEALGRAAVEGVVGVVLKTAAIVLVSLVVFVPSLMLSESIAPDS